MHSGDSGINKPFDRILKSFADEAPVLLVRLLGVIPVGAEVEIQPLRPETAPSVVLPDYVAMLRTPSGEWSIFHAEFQYKYHRDLPQDMARYGGSLAWQYRSAVESVLVLLRPDVPVEIPEVGYYNIGRTHTTHPFTVVRLWEIDPAPVLETNNPKLLPWALLMKSTDEQVRKIAWVVAHCEDDEAMGRFLTLGSVRYDRSSLDEMLGGGKMGLVRAILDGSSLVREEREQAASEGRVEGKAEGLEEGQAKGRTAEARKFLRLLLKKNFPDLESPPEIDHISDVATLDGLIERAFEAPNSDSIRDAILAAAKAN